MEEGKQNRVFFFVKILHTGGIRSRKKSQQLHNNRTRVGRFYMHQLQTAIYNTS